jgi:hypothetical protein
MSLRFQPLGLTQPHTFVEATVAPQVRGRLRWHTSMCTLNPPIAQHRSHFTPGLTVQSSDKASVRASLFDVRSGLGVTLAAPLAKRLSGTFAQVRPSFQRG